jgi:hypothetical protein
MPMSRLAGPGRSTRYRHFGAGSIDDGHPLIEDTGSGRLAGGTVAEARHEPSSDLRIVGACIRAWTAIWVVIFIPTWSRYEAHQEQLAQRSGDAWLGQPWPSYVMTLTIVVLIGGLVCGGLTFGGIALVRRLGRGALNGAQ